MKILAVVVAGLSLGGCMAGAQTTEAAISGRLLGKPLQLRGFWMEDNLKFDASGAPLKTYKTGSFTESGFDAKKVKLDGNHLEIEGERVGLVGDEDEMTEDGNTVFERETLHKKDKKVETVKIEIEGGADADFTKALDAIFATSLEQLAPDVPLYWQEFFHRDVLHEKTVASRISAKPSKIGGSVQPPRVLKSVNPGFSEAARGQKFSGHSLISLFVDKEGMPEDIQVKRPIGLGLDDQAVKAVSQYRFKPALKNGQPVEVTLDIEVNFQIF